MNVQVMRIATKFRKMFGNEIDMSDINQNADNFEDKYNSRCLAAYAIVMQCGVENDVAAKSVTDGFHDNGVDAVYKDENSKILYVVQSKWSNDGNGTIPQGDSLKFVSGVEKLLNIDFSDCNDKILRKRAEIESAVMAMDYQIKMIIVYTSNSECPNETVSAIDALKGRINDEMNELLLFDVIILKKIYDNLANAASNYEINLNDVLLNDWGVIQEGTAERGYYGMVSASDIALWWQGHGNNLFARNIRYFKGDTEVNNGIIRCLKEEPQKFCYYNKRVIA